MRARTIHDALAQGRTVQKGGSNPSNPRQITPWVQWRHSFLYRASSFSLLYPLIIIHSSSLFRSSSPSNILYLASTAAKWFKLNLYPSWVCS